jgi:hypothetical protein
MHLRHNFQLDFRFDLARHHRVTLDGWPMAGSGETRSFARCVSQAIFGKPAI